MPTPDIPNTPAEVPLFKCVKWTLTLCHYLCATPNFKNLLRTIEKAQQSRALPALAEDGRLVDSTRFRYLTTAYTDSSQEPQVHCDLNTSHRPMCLNTWSLSGGTVLGGCGTSQGWSQRGGADSPMTGLELCSVVLPVASLFLGPSRSEQAAFLACCHGRDAPTMWFTSPGGMAPQNHEPK